MGSKSDSPADSRIDSRTGPRAVGFAFVDVFAAKPLQGNPLSLIPDADGIPEELMKVIAREFNQSETTFLLSPSKPGADRRLRSFTPAGIEVFGAGHNAMGAWLWSAIAGRLPATRSSFIQEIGDDLLPVEVERTAEGAVAVTMTQSAPAFGPVLDDRAELARTLGLRREDLAEDLPTQVVGTGADHLLVPARDRHAVDASRPDSERLRVVLAAAGAEGCYLYSTCPAEGSGGAVAYARFFNPTVGIAEDPATGTAAGPLVALLVRAGLVAEATTAVVEQGNALGRPSRLAVRVTGSEVRLSGTGVVSAEGTMYV